MSDSLHKPGNYVYGLIGSFLIGLVIAVDNLAIYPPFRGGLLAVGVMLVFLSIWWLLEAILKEVRHTNRVEQSRKTNRDE